MPQGIGRLFHIVNTVYYHYRYYLLINLFLFI